MNAVYATKIIAGFAGAFVILMVIMMIILYRRRRKLIKMNYLVSGTVMNIQEQRGTRDKYYVSTIEYTHHQQGRTTVQRFSYRLPRYYAVNSQVDLYYHPEFPQKFILKNDTTTKVSLIVLGILTGFIAILAIWLISFLLGHAYP